MSAENKSSSLPLATVILIIIALICLSLALLVKNQVIKLPASWTSDRNQTASLEATTTPIPDYVTPSPIEADPNAPTITASEIMATPLPGNGFANSDDNLSEKDAVSQENAPAPPTPANNKVILNGTLHLQEKAPEDAQILLMIRPVGQAEYKVIQRFAPAATITWSWPEAVLGQKYDVTFALRVGETTQHIAPVGTGIAPATIDIWMNVSP